MPRLLANPRGTIMRAAHLLATTAILAAVTATSAAAEPVFNRIATFPVVLNLPEGADLEKETVSEIISVTEDGNLLVYTDSPREQLGLVDIADAKAPKPAGVVELDGEPTSVTVVGGFAFAAVNTSESYEKPDGHLAIVDLAAKKVVSKCELGGQPDSIAVSPDRAYLAIVLENERDEDKNDGAIPQLPSGNLSVVPLKNGEADCAGLKVVDLTGIADVAPDDAEPEFVDINSANQAVVTLQENNHIAVVDLASGKVVSHFSAGGVTLENVDTKKDKIISLDGKVENALREPDAVKWLDDDRFVTANEGDWKGGARGFTVFTKDGKVDFEAGATFEHEIVRLGHYPEHRNKKGVEVEGIETATFGSDRLIFVGSERASVVGIYKDNGAGSAPSLLQIIPGGGVGPEGLLAIPSRNLFVTASETDLREDGGVGSMVTIFERAEGVPAYPTLVSADRDGKPQPWGAISGTVADTSEPGKLYAVSDSAYAQGYIYTIDATKTPAVITDAITVTRDGEPATGLDLEGIALASGGGFWLASEGNPEHKDEAKRTNSQLVRASAKGDIQEVIELPDELKAHATRFGFEGVTVTGSGADETVWIAVQREWKDDEKGFAKILAYKPASKSWGAVLYPLDKVEKGWIGLSEVTAVGEDLVFIERDNQIGDAAKIKKLTRVSLKGVTPAALGSKDLPVLTKQDAKDFLPLLKAANGYVHDKIESFAIDANGDAFAITDNDGVDDASGETQFLRLGKF